MSATGFLYGLATEELTREELDFHDPDYQLIVGVRAIRHSERNQEGRLRLDRCVSSVGQ